MLTLAALAGVAAAKDAVPASTAREAERVHLARANRSHRTDLILLVAARVGADYAVAAGRLERVNVSRASPSQPPCVQFDAGEMRHCGMPSMLRKIVCERQ